MKAAYIEQTGPPESIVYGDLPRPEPAGAQVLVRVAAVAVNPVDTYVRAGAIAAAKRSGVRRMVPSGLTAARENSSRPMASSRAVNFGSFVQASTSVDHRVPPI